MERAARGERHIVVVTKNGSPARVYGYEEFARAKSVPGKHRIWTKRSGESSIPDPLKAVEGKVLGPLSRKAIYE